MSGDKRRFKVFNPSSDAYGNAGLLAFAEVESARDLRPPANFLNETLHTVNCMILRSNFLRSMYITAGGAGREKITIFSRQGLDFPALPPGDGEWAGRPALRGGLPRARLPRTRASTCCLRQPAASLTPIMEVNVYGDAERFPSYSARLQRIIANDERLSLAGSYKGYEEEARA